MTGLKPHEIRTLQLVAHGYTSRQIARRLNITERSAEQRIWRASRKLGATGRTHAVALAIGAGYITPPTPTRTTN